MMAVAGMLTLLMIALRHDTAYALVVVWALVGSYNRPFGTAVFRLLSGLNAGMVDTVALMVALIVAGGILTAFVARYTSAAFAKPSNPSMSS